MNNFEHFLYFTIIKYWDLPHYFWNISLSFRDTLYMDTLSMESKISDLKLLFIQLVEHHEKWINSRKHINLVFQNRCKFLDLEIVVYALMEVGRLEVIWPSSLPHIDEQSSKYCNWRENIILEQKWILAGEENIFDEEKESAALHFRFQVLKILKTEFW